MSVPAEDSEHRARSIFERLRAEQTAGQPELESDAAPLDPAPSRDPSEVSDPSATDGPPAAAAEGEGPASPGPGNDDDSDQDDPGVARLPTAPPPAPPAERRVASSEEASGDARTSSSQAAPASLPADDGGEAGPTPFEEHASSAVSPAPSEALDDDRHALGPDGDERGVVGESGPTPAPPASWERPASAVSPVDGHVAAPSAAVEAATAAPIPDLALEELEEGARPAHVDAGAVPAPPEPVTRPVRPLPRIVAVANQKGGVGKTTTAVNLGASLAELGHRVLVVDLDPQGNATTGLGINSRNLERSIYDVILHDTPIEDCIEPTTLRNLFVAPATIDLAGAEIELVPAFSRELRLRRALERIHGDYDFTLIDCPPSLGLLTINGLAAADEVLVPIQCEYYALEGLGQLLRNVTLVQGNLNPRLEVANIVLTMYDARTRLAEQVAQEVRDHFGATVCRNVVPRTVRLSEAPSFGQPIIVFDPSSRGSLAYRELAKEVVGGTS